MASRVAAGRVATVSIDRMAFMVPVAVGAQLSFYTQTLEVGRSSIRMLVEVWSDDPLSSEWRKVTEAVFVFVAIDGSGRTVRSRRAAEVGQLVAARLPGATAKRFLPVVLAGTAPCRRCDRAARPADHPAAWPRRC